MFTPALFLLAALVVAPDPAIPRSVEVRPGIFVLRGAPNDATCNAIQKQHITHVIDLRRDGEPNMDCQTESTKLQELGVHYLRYAMTKAPPPSDFDFIREFINGLPRGSKVLIHCDNGNRAAAVICSWLVLDKGMSVEEAMRLSREAGLQIPETEAALRKYLSAHGRT